MGKEKGCWRISWEYKSGNTGAQTVKAPGHAYQAGRICCGGIEDAYSTGEVAGVYGDVAWDMFDRSTEVGMSLGGSSGDVDIALLFQYTTRSMRDFNHYRLQRIAGC